MFNPDQTNRDILAIFERLKHWEESVFVSFHTRIDELEKRVGELEGHVTVAGVGATQAQGVTIPAEEIGSFEGEPNKTVAPEQSASQEGAQTESSGA